MTWLGLRCGVGGHGHRRRRRASIALVLVVVSLVRVVLLLRNVALIAAVVVVSVVVGVVVVVVVVIVVGVIVASSIIVAIPVVVVVVTLAAPVVIVVIVMALVATLRTVRHVVTGTLILLWLVIASAAIGHRHTPIALRSIVLLVAIVELLLLWMWHSGGVNLRLIGRETRCGVEDSCGVRLESRCIGHRLGYDVLRLNRHLSLRLLYRLEYLTCRVGCCWHHGCLNRCNWGEGLGS